MFMPVCSMSDCRFESQLSYLIFMQIDYDTIFTVILSLPLIQEGQLLATGEMMKSNVTKYWLTTSRTKRTNLPRKSECKLNDWLDLTSTGLTGP